ncbi:YicC/YloC family endoribonuclease [Candidatus Vallotiella sp. (ex Adelges kitamiensis)]|uniref:YicC/YloC family endoribonuclease n=1 Tax=Candidatus Vallotiella sp. (ex Adelges kitamiensis) TaxID=2864217 RepID=UPI001CE2B90F|nr:YicC/YloC family endoribonuclease [Candidatus Vallotia sp. (ex Adelges kitamiensis)]
MICSMTGYASVTQELLVDGMLEVGSSAYTASVSVELRTVNSRFLDFNFRIPEEVRACEIALRKMIMNRLSRGKIDIYINVQNSKPVAMIESLDRNTLLQLAALECAVLDVFPKASSLHIGEILRWPGVISDRPLSTTLLHDTILSCSKKALNELISSRRREGEQLATILLANITEMEVMVSRITPLVPELVTRHQNKIIERLKTALSMAMSDSSQKLVLHEEIIERIRQEVTMYSIRIDIAEELSRLGMHLAETRYMITKGGQLGKKLDFMMQELNREANTLGSKAATKELADASMMLKLLIEQMREQIQNLE